MNNDNEFFFFFLSFNHSWRSSKECNITSKLQLSGDFRCLYQMLQCSVLGAVSHSPSGLYSLVVALFLYFNLIQGIRFNSKKRCAEFVPNSSGINDGQYLGWIFGEKFIFSVSWKPYMRARGTRSSFWRSKIIHIMIINLILLYCSSSKNIWLQHT